MVVTSPIGLNAPPALAAITTIPANNKRIFPSGNNLLNKETINMVVVKLSSTAESIKVTIAINQSKLIGLTFVS